MNNYLYKIKQKPISHPKPNPYLKKVNYLMYVPPVQCSVGLSVGESVLSLVTSRLTRHPRPTSQTLSGRDNMQIGKLPLCFQFKTSHGKKVSFSNEHLKHMGGLVLMVISPKIWEFTSSLCPHWGLFNHI